MLRRVLTVAVVAAGLFAWGCVLVACGYIALPGGWTINFPGFSGSALAEPELRARVTVPPGFSIGTYAAGLANPRMLLFTAAGDLLVSLPRAGTVVLLARDGNGDGVADAQRVLLGELKLPHGLAYRDGWLYVAEGDAVLRVRFDPTAATISGSPERIVRGLPAGGNHWTRTVHIGPDDKLYVSIGSSCNVCLENDPRRAAILRFNLDGSGGEIYATGLRNAVDFAWQPGTGDLYATCNARDLLGDDFPPDPIFRVVRGGFYGWPFANGRRVPDPDYGTGHEQEIAASIPPAHELGAHVAPLGIAFYEPPAAAPAAFPRRYRDAAFVAEHGSWNRSKKSGYQVVALFFGTDGVIAEEPFATGFMRDEQVFGRPVDPAVGPDGALYVSDDFAGSVYRIAYGSPAAAAAPTKAAAATLPDPMADLSAADIATAAERGAALWNAQPCAACHAPGTAAPDALRPLSGLRSRYTVDSLSAFLRAPRPPMPPVALSDDQRRDLAIYLLTQHP